MKKKVILFVGLLCAMFVFNSYKKPAVLSDRFTHTWNVDSSTQIIFQVEFQYDGSGNVINAFIDGAYGYHNGAAIVIKSTFPFEGLPSGSSGKCVLFSYPIRYSVNPNVADKIEFFDEVVCR